MPGKFITLEGIDGAGKTTHIAWLAAFLRDRGIDVTVTREPGGTQTGERLRELLLDRAQRLQPETETLLMFAARREHLDTVIVPTLQKGNWVLCDRFTDATFAYQGGGSGVSWEKIQALEEWVQEGLQPDVTFLFDVSPDAGRSRSGKIKPPDRFEQEKEAFFERVRAAYLRRAGEHPERIRVVDANVELAQVTKQLEKFMLSVCS
jgi:dTMP kinase